MSFSINVTKRAEGGDTDIPEASYESDAGSLLGNLADIRKSHNIGGGNVDRATGQTMRSQATVTHVPTGTKLEDVHLGYLGQGYAMDDVLHFANKKTRGEWPEGAEGRRTVSAPPDRAYDTMRQPRL